MSESVTPLRSDGSEGLRGFTKRASRVVSNASLFDLVQDMALVLDTLPGRLNRIEEKVDLIVDLLGKRMR